MRKGFLLFLFVFTFSDHMQVLFPNGLFHKKSNTGKRIESAVRKALYRFEMLSEHKRIVIALSGGKDSLSLMLMLAAIRGKGFPYVDLHAVHVGGKFSCGSEIHKSFLKNICDKLDISFSSIDSPYSPDVPECYSCSRFRRRILFKAAEDLDASAVAFGHHKNDSIQTTLMNLFHKGEFAGLPPVIHMHRFNVTILRPLIFVEENDIKKFARENGFLRTTCRCPVVSLRSKTITLIEDLKTIFPQIENNIFLTSLKQGSNKSLSID